MSPDLDTLEGKPYKYLLKLYQDNFSLGYLNTDINNKFALISLVCFVTYRAKEKKPDVTHYSILMAIVKDMDIPNHLIKALAVICDDFAYGTTDFPTFGIAGKDIIPSIKKILQSYVPF